MLTARTSAGMVDHIKRDGNMKRLTHPVSMCSEQMKGVDSLDQQLDYVAEERPFTNFGNVSLHFLTGWHTFCSL